VNSIRAVFGLRRRLGYFRDVAEPGSACLRCPNDRTRPSSSRRSNQIQSVAVKAPSIGAAALA
jgi:hypothetical protein